MAVSIGAKAPGGGTTSTFHLPLRMAGEFGAAVVLLRLESRDPGAPLIVQGTLDAHAEPALLRLWTSRDKWPSEARASV